MALVGADRRRIVTEREALLIAGGHDAFEVGPLESMTVRDFREAMNTNFWGAFNVIHAAFRHLRPGESRIVNISSIGGLVSVPHLLPYSASKFALQGFSLGLRQELEGAGGVDVTAACQQEHGTV